MRSRKEHEMNVPLESTAPGRGGRPLQRLLPVRLLVFFVILVFGDVTCQLALRWAQHHAPQGDADWVVLAGSIALAAALIGIYAALVHGMERRKATEVSPASAGQGLAGVFLGLVLFTVALGLIHVAGSARLLGMSASFDVVPTLAFSILAAVGEELAVRGGVLRILEEGCGTMVALTLSATIFGLLHALNPGATVISTVGIAIEAGLLLGAAYALARNLWLPIGLHFGWNFTEAGIFGASVSGGDAGNGVFAVAFAGPRLLTGGKFGPEASLIAIAVCFTAALMLIAVTAKTGRWKPMQWRMILE
jgi:membrane protease YdiL (CAAX protease family)